MTSLLPILLASLLQSAPSPVACDLAGSYLLDRAPIHQGIMDSMDENLTDLGDRPRREGMAQTVWDAKRGAFEGVREEAAAGEIVPVMTLELIEDGRFSHLTQRHGRTVTESSGRWSADASCQTLVLESDDSDPRAATVEGDRITMTDATMNRDGTLKGLHFDRVR